MDVENFPTVLARLHAWRREVLESLSDPSVRESGVALKLEIEAAIGCLEWCARYGVRRSSQVVVLPNTIVQTPSSEYRIVEDCESDDRQYWIELSVGGEPLRPSPGTLVVENSEPRRSSRASGSRDAS